MSRLGIVAALVLSALIGFGGPAFAHNVLTDSEPSEGASVDAGPKQVRLVFDQPVREGYNTVTVVGPNNTHWADGQVRVDGSTVTAPVRELGPAGRYTVAYRVLSDDGHPVTGEIGFTLTKPGNGTPIPLPETAEDNAAGGDGGMPVWPWVVGAIVLLVAGVVLAMRLGGAGDRR